ncbi:MAG TPA: hypothetical protein HPQ00_09365, partial [Magnetococcales bacterium]|nr:hypothetical protein [Magnetococcales bacterium]
MDKSKQGQDQPVFLSLPDAIMPPGAYPFFTPRRGGGSLGVYESLNLGLHVGDNGDLVAHNRERVKHLLRPKARC